MWEARRPLCDEAVLNCGFRCLHHLHLFSVLLRAVLGHHPLQAGQGVSQAAGEGGRGQAQDGAL